MAHGVRIYPPLEPTGPLLEPTISLLWEETNLLVFLLTIFLLWEEPSPLVLGETNRAPLGVRNLRQLHLLPLQLPPLQRL